MLSRETFCICSCGTENDTDRRASPISPSRTFALESGRASIKVPRPLEEGSGEPATCRLIKVKWIQERLWFDGESSLVTFLALGKRQYVFFRHFSLRPALPVPLGILLWSETRCRYQHTGCRSCPRGAQPWGLIHDPFGTEWPTWHHSTLTAVALNTRSEQQVWALILKQASRDQHPHHFIATF